MNHLREKWATRARPSSSGASDSAGDASPVGQVTRRRAPVPAAATPAVATRAPEPLRRAMSTLETQRYDALAAWIKRSGIVIPARDRPRRDTDVFDEIYESLEDMEAAIKQDLALLLPKWQSSASETVVTPSRGVPVIDYIVVIGPDINDLVSKTFWRGQSELYEATVVLAHPPQSQFNAESIEQFCFPDGICVSDADAASEEFFVLMLSGGGGQGQDVQYACCLRQSLAVPLEQGIAYIPVCYAAVVRTPWIPFYQPLLRHVSEKHQVELEISVSHEPRTSIVPDALVQHVDSLMTELNLAELPGRGEMIRFTVGSLCETRSALALSCLRPHADCGSPEHTALLLEWSTPLLLSVLSIQSIILAVGLLLVEMKVVIISKSIPLLSAGTLGLSSMLYPLVWAGPLISVLPPSLHEYLEAPVPLLCGVETLPQGFILTKGTALLLMDNNEIQLHPDDGAQLGAFQFPGSEELTRQLSCLSQSLNEKPTKFTGSIISNIVVQRIRQELHGLLLLCARVNPYNAYACMKQEQLSLSETLFLKSFMQSQMYQKYSDDQPIVSPSSSCIQSQELDSAVTPSKFTATQGVSSSLRRPILELLSIFVTGSLPSERIEDPDLKTKTVNEHLGAAVSKSSSNNADGRAFMESTPAHVSSEQPTSLIVNVEDLPVSIEELTPRRLSSESEGENDNSVWAQDLDMIRTDICAQVPDTICDELHHAYPPTSTDVRFNALAHETRTVPPIQPDGSLPSSHSQAESGTQRSRHTLQANDELNMTRAMTQSQLPCLTDIARTVAAIKIQSAWRQHWRCFKPGKRSRAPSSAYADEAVEHIDAKIDLSVPLSLDTHDGRRVHVIMSLTSDKKSIKWSERDLELGSIHLDHIEEIRAQDGNIAIRMTDGRSYEFSVPIDQASVTMDFFHNLHRLATGSIGSPAHCEEPTGSSTTVIRHSSQLENACVDEESSSIDHNPREGIGSTAPSFYDSIRRGVLVLKHGRMGRPHSKYLMCDDDIRELIWIDPAITNLGYQAPPHRAHSYSTRATEMKSIRFDDIVDILPGKQTRVFQRPTAGRSNADLCFSVITRGRTLDIEAFSREEYTLLYDGIKQRVGAY